LICLEIYFEDLKFQKKRIFESFSHRERMTRVVVVSNPANPSFFDDDRINRFVGISDVAAVVVVTVVVVVRVKSFVKRNSISLPKIFLQSHVRL